MAAASWEEAKARVAAIQAEEAADPTIVPECRTRLLDHGAPTAQVVVLFHGYTNCPKQYEKLAPSWRIEATRCSCRECRITGSCRAHPASSTA